MIRSQLRVGPDQRFGLALRAAAYTGDNGGARRAALALQRFELRLQAGLVSCQRFLEQLALFSAHALGLGAKAPSLQACEFVRDALNIDVVQPDGVRLEIDLLTLLGDVLQLSS